MFSFAEVYKLYTVPVFADGGSAGNGSDVLASPEDYATAVLINPGDAG